MQKLLCQLEHNLSEILDEHEIDICCISEHWLKNYNLDYLNSIDNMYICYAVSDKNLMLLSNRKSW
jgi:hypothetical protein